MVVDVRHYIKEYPDLAVIYAILKESNGHEIFYC
jgi:hypothetical protein